MLTLLYLTCLSMYLRRVITADAFVCRRGTHVSGTDPRFDPEEQLASAAADFGWALAKMKCPSNYLRTYQGYNGRCCCLPSRYIYEQY
ncbi:uncharacterized protein [Aegilops tauschii subsp. strangulata]|uniref:uncharacterized protein isoform X2 n=1 Tax=Aegilops tauschii subsp. strangulata TaxID=200361 RepID=UPI003CC8721D